MPRSNNKMENYNKKNTMTIKNKQKVQIPISVRLNLVNKTKQHKLSTKYKPEPYVITARNKTMITTNKPVDQRTKTCDASYF